MSPRASLRVEGSPARSERSSQDRTPWCRHNYGFRSRSPETAADRASVEHWWLTNTGLPSRSALVAPPLRLVALRWRVALVVLVWIRPPPVVSTACLLAVTHFSRTPFPGEPHTALCPYRLERWRHNTVYRTPAGARCLVHLGVREGAQRSEALLGAHGAVPGIRRSRSGRRRTMSSFSGAWLRHARPGEPASADSGSGQRQLQRQRQVQRQDQQQRTASTGVRHAQRFEWGISPLRAQRPSGRDDMGGVAAAVRRAHQSPMR
jgi:hypothetical protein